jgi:superfamily II DNA or RNA helicase
MAKLKPAGFWGQVGSLFLPKRLTAHVRTESLPDGQVQVTPYFTIDGQEVPAELIQPAQQQSILGYNVVLDPGSQYVHMQTRGRPTRLAKRKAAEFLGHIAKSRIPVRSRNGTAEPRVEEVKPEVSLELHPDDSLSVRTELVTKDGVVIEHPPSLTELKAEDGWFNVGDDLLRVAPTEPSLDGILDAAQGGKTLQGDDVPRLLKLLSEHAGKLGFVNKNEPLRDLAVFSGSPTHTVRVDGTADAVSVTPSLEYTSNHGRRYAQSVDDASQMEGKGGGFRRVPDGWVEIRPETLATFRAACGELHERLGDLSDVRGPDIPTVLAELARATGHDRSWSNPWAVYFSKAVQDSHRLVDSPAVVDFALNIVESDGRSLFELDPMYNHDRFKVSHEEAEAAARNGSEWVRRKDAWVKVDLERFQKIDARAKALGLQRSGDGFTFPASEREHVIEVFSVLGSIRHSAAYADFLAKLADFDKIEDVPLPTSLRREIIFRPYQKHGYNWLAFLHRFGLNGILADDMGLGKTLQTLAVIQRAKELGNATFPTLIICPTSVVNNWRAEIQKFFHGCEVIVYAGGNRARRIEHLRGVFGYSQSERNSPFVITSYDVARRDHHQLNQIPWLYVVVDEGHNIKNPTAKKTKAIKTINGRHKLALTGTPIQNSLQELWSLFDFAMPGYLGTSSEFTTKYGRGGNIDWDAVRDQKAPLKQRVHPFILRRLKENVAKDLPSKTIVPQLVELTPKQVALYKAVVNSPEYRKLVESIDEKGVRRSSTLILAAFAKLRNICNHPVLADGRGSAVARADESGKLDALQELMEEVIEGQHRALLFCQSTQMLDIIQRMFDHWKVRTLRLDGSTPPNQRQSLVDQFNGSPEIHCFLISTKAGGTGLNLTGADTVIFYDHDWNPANDNQAQDRAYRIGQTKPVTVYKLISQGTIEEKIIERQRLKQTLADEIIGDDEAGFKDLTKEELLALFKLDDIES